MNKKYRKIHILFRETGTSLSIDLTTKMVENWYFDEAIHVNYKTSDTCVLKFETDKKEIYRYEGYVPDFFPAKHYGDYIMLTISKKGFLKKFIVTDEQIDELLEE